VQAANTLSFSSPEWFSATVLSRQLFGQASIEPARFPDDVQQEMDRCAEIFRAGRGRIEVKWSAALSTVEAVIQGRQCVMSGEQALILQALMDGPMNSGQIAGVTGLSQPTVESNLAVMQKRAAGRIVVANGSGFAINEKVAFKSDSVVRFPSPQTTSPDREKAVVESNAEAIKENRITCAIVQKMKAMKRASIWDLLTSVQKMLTFPIDHHVFIQVLGKLERTRDVEKCGDKYYKYVP
jgi:hypothetical protein